VAVMVLLGVGQLRSVPRMPIQGRADTRPHGESSLAGWLVPRSAIL
jgi:hypothetical protein